jgi:hypothetical protein
VRHRRELAAYGLRGEMEAGVEHGPNFGIERTRRTINSRRTANSGLTDCLSLGVHRTETLAKPRSFGRWIAGLMKVTYSSSAPKP